MSRKIALVRVGILVERHDSKLIPFTHKMFYLRQRSDSGVADWAQESVGLLGVLGGVPGEQSMKVGERWRYWAHIRLIFWQDYWGECDQDVEFLSCKRAT